MTAGIGPLRVAIVDDEPLARAAVRRALAGHGDIEIVGDAADGPSSVALIDRAVPDVVFLDIELPGLSGLEVLERARHRPAVIFTTAHDHYAIRALQAGAIDYVLKPFGAARLHEALARVASRLRDGLTDAGLIERLRDLVDSVPHITRVYVRKGREIACLALTSVTHIQASDDYVTLHADGDEFLLAATMAALEEQLDPAVFLRVHRSHIVNLDHVESAIPEGERRFRLRMRDGREVPVSRSGAAAFRRRTRS